MFIWSYLALFIMYVAVAIVITWIITNLAGRLGGGRRARTMLACIIGTAFVVIPVWDIPLAQREYEHYCQLEAGSKIKRSVADVTGVLSYTFGGRSGAEEFIKKYGYDFFEYPNGSKNHTRYSLNDHGQLVEQKVDKASSRYRIEIEYTSLDYVNKKEMFVEDTQSKEKLAVQIAFSPRGGWVSQWLRFSYGDFTCEPQRMTIEDFVTGTLRPSNRVEKEERHGNHS